MKKVLQVCNDVKPITVPILAFMAGLFYSEGFYWLSAFGGIVIILNALYELKENIH